jgi:hypothetical protein
MLNATWIEDSVTTVRATWARRHRVERRLEIEPY